MAPLGARPRPVGLAAPFADVRRLKRQCNSLVSPVLVTPCLRLSARSMPRLWIIPPTPKIMAEGTGLLVRFDEPRRSDLIRQTVEGTYEPFSDALSIHDWDVRNAQ